MHESGQFDLIDTFRGIVGAECIRAPDKNEIGVARLIVEPIHGDQIADVVRKCESDGLPLVPMGASRTLAQIRGQPVAVGISLVRMNRIIDYEPDDMTIVVEAGLTLGALNECAAKHGQRLPCDPREPELTTLGALVGTGETGPLRLSEGR